MASRRAFHQTRTVLNTYRKSQSQNLTCSVQWAQKHGFAEKEQSELHHSSQSAGIHPNELEQLFAQPTWSVEVLLPQKTCASNSPRIASERLHHLLRLSALPPPTTPEQEQKMLDTLADQLYFVGKIQSVDTSGVTPLTALRDETAEAMEEQTITLDTLKQALQQEKVIGKHHRRIRRDTSTADARDEETWDILGSAERKQGKYFIVESERPLE